MQLEKIQPESDKDLAAAVSMGLLFVSRIQRNVPKSLLIQDANSKTLIDPETVKAWVYILRGTFKNEIATAFEKWAKQSEFFPAPNQILEIIKSARRERAVAAMNFQQETLPPALDMDDEAVEERRRVIAERRQRFGEALSEGYLRVMPKDLDDTITDDDKRRFEKLKRQLKGEAS